MKLNKVKAIVLAGITAFIGIIAIQVFWLKQAFDLEEKKFSQNVQVSLLEVANELNSYYGYTTAHVNPIEKISRDYYIVNMRNDFDAKVLELMLVNTFKEKGITSNFEYAIYDCKTDDMLYGSYINLANSSVVKHNTYFPKAQDLVYYFAVRFPEKNIFIYKDLKGWIILCLVMLVTLLIYFYAIYIILQQQKFAGLQRDFINNMTHEFKTPLSSILIASQYLSTHENILADEKLRQYTGVIIAQGKKLDNHLEKILHVAKNDNNPLLLDLQSVDIAEIIQQTISIIQLKYPVATITVNNHLPSNRLRTDPFHFANIIYNFLDNSIKYCDKTPFINIDLKNYNSEIILTITDNGIGIAPRYLKQIFEKFFRVPENKELAVNGFGLGLYYVKKICGLQSWKLSASSSPGIGTVITLIMKQ